eukprot:3904578-Rhodomonas_salina.1
MTAAMTRIAGTASEGAETTGEVGTATAIDSDSDRRKCVKHEYAGVVQCKVHTITELSDSDDTDAVIVFSNAVTQPEELALLD